MGRDTGVPNGSVGTRRHAACCAGAEKRRREREATGASNASPVARHEQDERRGSAPVVHYERTAAASKGRSGPVSERTGGTTAGR